MSLSRKQKKVLIGVGTGVSLGVLSWFVWNRLKKPKISPLDSLGVFPEVDERTIDDRQLLQVEPKVLPERCSYMTQSELRSILKSGGNESNHVIIDVRDENMDYSGGHIVGSTNISDIIFYEAIPDLIKAHSSKAIIVMYCMYGYRRAVKCMEFYVKAISEIIANYNRDTKTSHYLMYSLKSENAENVEDSRIHLMMYPGGKYQWMDDSVSRKKVDITFTDDEMFENLQKQKLYVLKGGFFGLINDIEQRDIIEGFDQSVYEELELRGLCDKKMFYHKNEYYARKKFMEMKEKQKSMNFKMNSSRFVTD